MGGKIKQNVFLTVLLLCLFTLIDSVKANDTSGACVWWLLFTFTIVTGGSAYMFYLVYVLKQPLGKSHGLQHADGQEVKKDIKDNKQKEERKDKHQNDINRGGMERPKQASEKDSSKSSQMMDRRNNPINTDEVKVKIEEQANKNLNNQKTVDAAKNFINKELIEGKAKENFAQSQPQYIQKPQSANNPLGAGLRPTLNFGAMPNRINEDEEEESEEEESEEEVEARQNQFIQARNQFNPAQNQFVPAQNQQARTAQQPGPLMQLRERPS